MQCDFFEIGEGEASCAVVVNEHVWGEVEQQDETVAPGGEIEGELGPAATQRTLESMLELTAFCQQLVEDAVRHFDALVEMVRKGKVSVVDYELRKQVEKVRRELLLLVQTDPHRRHLKYYKKSFVIGMDVWSIDGWLHRYSYIDHLTNIFL
jgi:hypothetical protein